LGAWNGLDLQTEFSTILNDTSTSFKTEVLRWMNEIQIDICSRFAWNFLRQKGKKVLTAETEQQLLDLGQPTAPTAVIAAGGSLTEDSVYSVIITFVEGVAAIESKAGVASSNVTATSANKTITVTDIPTSSDPLVTARKVYLVKDSGEPLYYSTISDNTTTTASITADSSSTIEAPDHSYFNKLSGNLFLEGDSSGYINYESIDQLRLMFQGSWSTGTPEFWSDIDDQSVIIYPKPSSALTLSFYYFKLPSMIFADATSIPTIPIWMKRVLKAGVIALGYEFRDRAGTQQKFANYETYLQSYISKQGRNKKTPTRVRDVVGNSDGWSI